MPSIRIKDERKYPLDMFLESDPDLDYYRWEHRATVSKGKRIFLVFVDNGIINKGIVIKTPKAYIEEITSGKLERIKSDDLWEELNIFVEEKGLTEMQLPLKK